MKLTEKQREVKDKIFKMSGIAMKDLLYEMERVDLDRVGK